MSVQSNEVTSDVWTRWQGQVINGAFPLGRFLGCSDHSGVFLTKSAEHHLSQVAIKLVPADRSLAESQLPRWKRAGRLAHPHLLPMFAWGGCQLDGLPYLYNVTEYADQTLAQLLLHRALTEDEAREMLLPILDALAFLHGRNLVHGQLKPTNILVVGDQLKLATDTIRRVREGKMGRDTPPMHESPDRQGTYSTAGDIRALGVSLFEALTRRSPAGLGESMNAVALPADFSPVFREVVTRCLNPRPQDRPSVAELVAWAGGSPLGPEPAATLQPVVLIPPEPRTTEPPPPRTVPQHFSPAAARRRAIRDTGSEAERLTHCDSRGRRDSCAGLDGSEPDQKPSHPGSASTPGPRWLPVTDSGQHPGSAGAGERACRCRLHDEAGAKRCGYVAAGAP